MKKKTIGFLIAGLLFYFAAIIVFIAFEENKIIFLSAFATCGTAFIVLYKTRSGNRKNT